MRGTYICTTCGVCCMHHEQPVCELATWMKHTSGCPWCAGNAPFVMDMSMQRMSYDEGRIAAIQAQTSTGARPLVKTLEMMLGLRVEPLYPLTSPDLIAVVRGDPNFAHWREQKTLRSIGKAYVV